VRPGTRRVELEVVDVVRLASADQHVDLEGFVTEVPRQASHAPAPVAEAHHHFVVAHLRVGVDGVDGGHRHG